MKTIFDAVHGYMHFEDDLVRVINTPEFQRLKRIKQLASAHYVFPTAVHTRFEHSLGVAHLAGRMADCLQSRHPDLKVDSFSIKLAGMCHDLGHGPLSHAYDSMLGEAHEARSASTLRRIVRRYCIPIHDSVVEKACELIHPRKGDLPTYMYQIIANGIDEVDVDKLDYLKRDSLFTGVGYGVDVDRFFEYARVIDGRICYAFKGMRHCVNHLFMVRHQLHAQVYQHPVVRAVERMHMDFMRLLGEGAIRMRYHGDPRLTDVIFTREFVELVGGNKEAERLLDRMERRDLYKCVAEFPVSSFVCSEMEEGYAPDPESGLLVDAVRIGYAHNPLFRVRFFKEDTAELLNPETESSVFRVGTQDCLLRVYQT